MLIYLIRRIALTIPTFLALMFLTFAAIRLVPGDPVEVRVGVSFVSVEQARRNLEREMPDGTTLEQTARTTRAAWAEKLDRVRVWGASREQLVTFYTALFHTLQVCSRFFLLPSVWRFVDVESIFQVPV